MLLRDKKAYLRTFSQEKTEQICVSVIWGERTQVGNRVAEESAEGQKRKAVNAEERQWNYYYFSATEETELKTPCEFVGW